MEYTDVEVSTWKTIYRNLKKLFKTNACAEFNRILPLLEENCGYSEDNIPQLQDVSTFLQSKFHQMIKGKCTQWVTFEFGGLFLLRLCPSVHMSNLIESAIGIWECVGKKL